MTGITENCSPIWASDRNIGCLDEKTVLKTETDQDSKIKEKKT